MTSNNTLSCLDTEKKSIKTFIDFPILANERNTKWGITSSVIEDKEGLIWCGFFVGEKGAFCLNPKTGKLQQYNLFPEKPKKAYYNQVYSVYEDRSGIIWIGTWGSGIVKLDKRKDKFQVLKSDPNNFSNCLSHPEVYSVIFDQNKFIWYSTRRALDKYDIKNETYKHYLNNEKCITQGPYSAIQDKSGSIWIGTVSCGLIKFDPINEHYSYYFNNPNESTNLVNRYVAGLFLDHLGILWIPTSAAGFGLYKYDITNNKLTHYEHNPNDPTSLSEDRTDWIFEDSFGTLWVGTKSGGLDKYDRATDKFHNCGFTGIVGLYEDKQGNFWVADYFNGLNLYDRDKGIITATYGREDGLGSNFVLGILEDDHSNLWIGTENGLSKFNTKARTFRNYYKEDGLPDNRFTIGSICGKGPDGKMYFHTSGGLIVFHPDSIIDDPTPPQIVISRISLFNRPDEKISYEGFISELKEITLPFDQNDLRFDFVGLHFSAPAENKYKYILENFDDDWVNAGTQRNATYTNLSPGEYVFKVTSSNKDGVWNEAGTSIRIIILPPWWKTWWAYILYTVFLISIFTLSSRIYLNRQRLKQKLVLESEHAEKLEEVARLKSNFFTNISHEFRTPLTLILGPAKQLKERITDIKSKEELDLIHRSAKKLNRLVDELLDISKIESGEMKLKACPLNLVTVVKELALSFYSLAERKNIVFNLISDDDEIIVYIDKDKVDKILSNVLSNAFKFTPEGGKVEVRIIAKPSSFPPLVKGELKGGSVEISIRDTGIGIPKDQTEKIFNRFYQVDGSHTREQEGTGIGLALTKELMDLHKGKIEVESEESKGSTFRLIFPLGKEHLRQEEICEESLFQTLSKGEGFSEEIISTEETNTEKYNIDLITETGKPLLLIVEDNPDVRKYIRMILENNYQIYESKDGEEGLNKSFEIIPDLIISDIMMPKMDGFQLCGKLKTDSRTSHIPVIMLTAKATMNDKLNGLEIGADDYIMKPFEAEELKARIKNLLEQRKRLHEHFRKYGLFEIEEKNITSVDQKFLEKAVAKINKHISDVSFGVEFFADDMAMSRSLLFKKINSLTGESPVDLIKRIRLNKAAKLLESNSGNISEIALEVGFSNPSYFAECFRKQFGVAPSQYHQKS